MATLKKRPNLFISEEGVRVRQLLEVMVDDGKYNTDSSYSANAEQYPDNLIPFVDKHMNYLNSHPGIEPFQYISNLRLMTRLKVS